MQETFNAGLLPVHRRLSAIQSTGILQNACDDPGIATSRANPNPDFNPIENAFSKLKALLRKAAERTVNGLWNAIALCLDLFTPQECANYFVAARYDPL